MSEERYAPLSAAANEWTEEEIVRGEELETEIELELRERVGGPVTRGIVCPNGLVANELLQWILSDSYRSANR